MKRRKYFGREQAFEVIWQNADREGMWLADAASLAAEFDVSEDEAHSVLSELCDRRLIEKVYKQTYVIVNWRERNDPDGPSESF
ncbi:MAG TPA: hypothetical protein VGR81_13365 [Candidatus Acidoferrales bacterium]|nr:hypothetical protein [Candidatus Acidoferrales bacterium]